MFRAVKPQATVPVTVTVPLRLRLQAKTPAPCQIPPVNWIPAKVEAEAMPPLHVNPPVMIIWNVAPLIVAPNDAIVDSLVVIFPVRTQVAVFVPHGLKSSHCSAKAPIMVTVPAPPLVPSIPVTVKGAVTVYENPVVSATFTKVTVEGKVIDAGN